MCCLQILQIMVYRSLAASVLVLISESQLCMNCIYINIRKTNCMCLNNNSHNGSNKGEKGYMIRNIH